MDSVPHISTAADLESRAARIADPAIRELSIICSYHSSYSDVYISAESEE